MPSGSCDSSTGRGGKKPGTGVQVRRLDDDLLAILLCIKLYWVTATALPNRGRVDSRCAVPANNLLALLVVAFIAANLAGVERDADLPRVQPHKDESDRGAPCTLVFKVVELTVVDLGNRYVDRLAGFEYLLRRGF